MAQLVKAKRLWAASRKGDARAVAAMLGDKRFSVDVNCAIQYGQMDSILHSTVLCHCVTRIDLCTATRSSTD